MKFKAGLMKKTGKKLNLVLSPTVLGAGLIRTMKLSVLLAYSANPLSVKTLTRRTVSRVSRAERIIRGSSPTSSRLWLGAYALIACSILWRRMTIRSFLLFVCCLFSVMLLRLSSPRVTAWPGKKRLWLSGRNSPVRA